VESRIPNAVLGETDVVTTYSTYRDFNGVMFPTLIQQKMGGYHVLDIAVTKVDPNAAVAITVPDPVRTASERVTAEKVTEGVWFIAGGSHNSVAIEMKDHMVMVEAPLGEYRVQPVLEEVKKLAPGKPIRFVVNSHHHFDHSGGVRAAASTGATIVTQARSKSYFEEILARKSTIAPDLLAKSGKKPKVMGVEDKGRLTDGKRVIELYHIADSIHTNNYLMIYLPAEKLLIEADEYTPAAPGAKPPATPDPRHLNLASNIERLKLSVDRILPLHGRVVPVAELYAAIGKPAPR
jgi:glyoxylase-like metal-dependent hydrolase (beta-lactamase superfamily II)